MSDGSTQVTMFGADWCGDCRRSKKFMDTHNVAYAYIDVETDPEASDKVIAINGGQRSIPVIIFPDGTHLTEPSDKDLEAKLKSFNIL